MQKKRLGRTNLKFHARATKVDRCTKCAECEPKRPYNLPIIETFPNQRKRKQCKTTLTSDFKP
ncbi:MAG: hypothetical protein ACE5OV_00080 [Candidatus Bathyarchaeia archaeon]